MADNLPGLDDLLKSIREDDRPQSSSALAVVPKKPDDLVEEDIDSQILSILGLEDVFDLTYEEYASLLKEASVKGRMPNSQMTTESVELVSEEFKRVKNKTGRFKVKPKKVDINKVLNRRQPTPSGAIVKAQKLIPQGVDVAEEPKQKVDTENLQDDLLNGIGNILESLITIRTILGSQNKVEEKSIEKSRKETEKKKKKEREAALEKKKSSFELPKVLSKPVDDFFGAIKRFFKNILLGSVVLGLFNWLKDPANQKAIDGFTNFLENNAGIILGGLLAIAALPIATTLFGLTTGILGGIGVLTGALIKFGAFLVSPLGLGLLGALGLYGLAAKYRQIRDENIEQKWKDAERGVELIEKGGKPIMANTPSGVATIKQGNIPWWDLGAQWGNVKNKLFGKKDITKSEDLDELKREYNKVNNELYNKIQAYKSGDIRFNKDIENLSIEKNALSKRIKEVEKFAPKSSAPKDPYAGADGLQRQLDDLTKPQTPLVPGAKKSTATISVGEKAGYSASRGRVHAGRDIAAPSGTGLQVPLDSVITDKGVDSGYGNYVVFKDSNGVEHLYGHMLEASSYSKGDKVPAGTVIGRVGSTGRSTGPHLHWEVSRVMGEVGRPRQNVIDPLDMGFSAQAPFTGKVEAAKILQTKPPTPSIPSPTGRGNIVPLPILSGGGQQAAQSNSAPLQSPVPRFSSEDPNNMTMMVVKSIYNVVG